MDVPELDLDRAALRHLERAPHGVLVAGEVERHLRGRLEIELVRVEAPVIRVLQRVARLDAEQCLVRVGVGGGEVVDVAGGDERQLRLGGELHELRVDALLHVEPRVLELDVSVLAPEDLCQPVEIVARVGRPVLLERLADAPGEAAGEGDQARGVGLQQLPVDARLRVVALEIAERGELDQVRVALVRLGQQREVRVAARAGVAVVGDVDLAADDRLDPFLLRRLVEIDRAGERAVVGAAPRRASRARPRGRRAPGSGTPHRGSSTRCGRAGGRSRRSRNGHCTAALGGHLFPRKIGIAEADSDRARPLRVASLPKTPYADSSDGP